RRRDREPVAVARAAAASRAAEAHEIRPGGGRRERQLRVLSERRAAVVVTVHEVEDGQAVLHDRGSWRQHVDLVDGTQQGVAFGGGVLEADALAAIVLEE